MENRVYAEDPFKENQQIQIILCYSFKKIRYFLLKDLFQLEFSFVKKAEKSVSVPVHYLLN